MTPLLAIEAAERYVGGAYLVFLLLLLIYIAIMAGKLARIQRELASLAELAERRPRGPDGEHDVGHVHERQHEIDSVRGETRREEAAR
jgi:hypothetical protein